LRGCDDVEYGAHRLLWLISGGLRRFLGCVELNHRLRRLCGLNHLRDYLLNKATRTRGVLLCPALAERTGFPEI